MVRVHFSAVVKLNQHIPTCFFNVESWNVIELESLCTAKPAIIAIKLRGWSFKGLRISEYLNVKMFYYVGQRLTSLRSVAFTFYKQVEL